MNTSAEQVCKLESVPKAPIRFREGLYGFETVKDYVLLQEDGSGAIWTLQAVEGTIPSFIVLDPFMVAGDYRPVLSREDYEALGSPAESDLCFLVIAVIGEAAENTFVNLKSPLVINVKTRSGKQVIMEESDYPVRYPLFQNRKPDRK